MERKKAVFLDASANFKKRRKTLIKAEFGIVKFIFV